LLYPGRRVWVVSKVDSVPFIAGPYTMVKFKQFLPRGAYERFGELAERKKSLIQIYTDPGGLRTVAAAEIRLQDPGRTGR